jgi:hypothetical protein
MKQNLERLSIDPNNPLSIVLESSPATEVGKVNNARSAEENAANAKELVDAWNDLVTATIFSP